MLTVDWLTNAGQTVYAQSRVWDVSEVLRAPLFETRPTILHRQRPSEPAPNESKKTSRNDDDVMHGEIILDGR